jgi:hypothetical protein
VGFLVMFLLFQCSQTNGHPEELAGGVIRTISA